MNELVITVCERCGNTYDPSNEGIYFDGQHLCNDCMDESTSICSRCGDRIWSDDACGEVYCQRCFDNYYTNCSICGRVIHYDDANYSESDEDFHDTPYCSGCFEEREGIINGYNYKPSPIFYGEGETGAGSACFYGVELEVDGAGEDFDNAKAILDIANKENEHIYIKHDGSLDTGFEIVTHPMSLQYHQTQMKWKDIMDKAISMGYRSHQAETCGLHIHVGRTALGETEDLQDSTIGRILFFIERYWNEMLKFSRRTETQINKWASRYGYKNSPKEVLQNAKDARLGQYVCINLSNYNTVEFRIFRGSLKLQTVIAALQMVDTLCNAAVFMSDEEFQSMTWNDFVSYIPIEKQELIGYLKLRRLYINEPVTESEEI